MVSAVGTKHVLRWYWGHCFAVTVLSSRWLWQLFHRAECVLQDADP